MSRKQRPISQRHHIVHEQSDQTTDGHFRIKDDGPGSTARHPRGFHGFLLKKGNHLASGLGSRRNWNKRYFRLEGNFLVYYANVPHGTKQNYKGVIPLTGVKIKIDDSQTPKHSRADDGWTFIIKHK